MVTAIVTAEVAFWAFLLAGLLSRYALRAPRLGRVLLACVPLVDLALVAFVAIDVAGGGAASKAQALAAIYLGVSVAFGRSLVAWADVRFAHRFAGGPAPTKPSKGSRAEVRALWVEWFRVVLAAAIAVALILVLIALRGFSVPGSQAALTGDPYWSTIVAIGVVTGIWLLAGPAFAGRGDG